MGRLQRVVKQNGIEISNRYADRPVYFELTPAGYSLQRALLPLLSRHVSGHVLDAGAGRLSWHRHLKPHATTITSLDLYREHPGLSCSGDLHRLPFRCGCFDTVFCSQVLEHVACPEKVLQEFARVLTPKGKLVISVPQLAYLHNEPHDYFRYTEYGLQALLKPLEFDLLETAWAGGLLCFLGHIPSTLLLNLTWSFRPLFYPALAVNRIWSRSLALLNGHPAKRKRFALNIVVVAQRHNAAVEQDRQE